MNVHQSFKVIETKSHKYIVCCPNKSAECRCPFNMKVILSKKTYSWKVTQWGGSYTCMNMSVTQDHSKLDSDLIDTYVVGTFLMFILSYFCIFCYLNFFILLTSMIRENSSIKISLIQERINNEFAYKVSYKKAWLAKKKQLRLSMTIGKSHMRNFHRD